LPIGVSELSFSWQASDAFNAKRNANRKEQLHTSVKSHPGAGTMNCGSSRYRSSLVREDAYFNEVDQILLANLLETLELQNEASECATGNRLESIEPSEISFANSDQFALAR
jgi:hypothetical protein